MTDVVETLVTEAKSPQKFDVLAAAKGQNYPEDDIVVYTDVVAAYQLQRLEAKIADTKDDDEVNALDAQRVALREAVKASALTFHLRGIAPGHIQALVNKSLTKFPDVEGEDRNLDRGAWFEGQIVAEHIVNVTNTLGEVDDHTWTSEEIQELKGAIHEDSFAKLLEGTNALSFASAYFDLAVNADF